MKFEDLKRITCAGIVLYNPELDKLKRNVDALYDQVDAIVMIDNASINFQSVKTLFSEYDRISYIENSENLGIAEALNQILRYADENGYQWYISMDQDSVCSKALMREYSTYVSFGNVATLCPYVLNNNKISLKEYKELKIEPIEEIKQPVDCITSGSLNNVGIAKKIGGYNSDLFIDCVDVDFNIRLFQHNYKIIRVNTTYMHQSMGKAKSVAFFQLLYMLTGKDIFRRLRYSPVYSDTRLYYISRNSKYICKKYGALGGKRMSSKWMAGQFAYYALTYPHSRNRVAMFRSINKGLEDSEKLI